MADLFTTDELQGQLRALYQARATGARRVKVGERETEFKSDSEMAAAIANLEARLASGRNNSIVIRSTKGW